MLRDPCRNEYDGFGCSRQRAAPGTALLYSRIEACYWTHTVIWWCYIVKRLFFLAWCRHFLAETKAICRWRFQSQSCLRYSSFPNRSFLLNKCCDERCLVIILSWLDADLFVQKRRQYVVGEFNFRAAPGISSFPLECCSWIALPLNSLMLISILSWCVLCPRW